MGYISSRVMFFIISGFLVSCSANAQDCDWARQKLADYRQTCRAVDNCSSMAQAEEFATLSCGAGPSRIAPAPTPPQAAAKPPTKAVPTTPKPPVSDADDLCRKSQATIANARTRWLEVAGEKARAYRDGINDLRALRRKVESAQAWQAGAFTELVSYLLQTTKITADLIGNLIAFNPATGVVNSIVRKGRLTAEQLYKRIEAGETVGALLTEELDKVYFELLVDLAADRSAIALAFKTLYDLASGIAELKEMPSDIGQLRAELSTQLQGIDRQIAGLEEKLRASNKYIQVEVRLREALNRNCASQGAIQRRLP